MPIRAIILAAGKSDRMKHIRVPKCLLKIGDKSILEYQITLLRELNIRDIVIVAGYKSDAIILELTKMFIEEESILFEYPALIYNPDYTKTENLVSLWSAKRKMKDNDILILNGDVLFKKEDLISLISEEGLFKLLIQQKGCDKEDMKVKGHQIGPYKIEIEEISKNIALNEAYGEFMGVSLISSHIVPLFVEHLDRIVDIAEKEYYEYAFDTFGTVKVGILSKHPYFEIDTPYDLKIANKRWRE